jgi:hypothetical protein
LACWNRGLIGGEKTGLIVSAFLPRNFDFLKGYAESVEQKQIALQKNQTRVYQGKRIEALARGQEALLSPFRGKLKSTPSGSGSFKLFCPSRSLIFCAQQMEPD